MAHEWEESYRAGSPPWDSGEPASELVATVARLGLSGGRAIELGCGTGTNAVWLARHGFAVTAIDVAPTAIARARARAEAAKVEVRLLSGDVLARGLLPAGTADLVFDRGVFHTMEGDDRAAFVDRVVSLLAPGGVWLSLLGNADQQRGEEGGPNPPRWTAREVVEPVEPRLRIEELVAAPLGDGLLGWRLVARPRSRAA